MNLIKLPSFIFISLLVLFGCAEKVYQIPNVSLGMQSPMTAASYRAVDQLLFKQNPTTGPMALPDSNVSILVSTIVDVNNLDQSSTFGRLLAQQMAVRISQHDIKVSEVNLRGRLFIDKEGELLLSRELKNINQTQNTNFVLVGTYAIGGEQIYVNVKLVNADDSKVSSAYNFSINKDRDMQGLLLNFKQ